MAGQYKVLLSNASTVGASQAVRFTEGRGTVILQGTFAHQNNKVDIECSYDEVNFVPMQGLTDINEPIAITFELAMHVSIRANLKNIQHGHTPSLTVVIC